MVIDLTFIHQRPQAIAMIWSLVGFISLLFFCIIPQISSAGHDRKLFYQVWILPCITSFIFAFFFYPETYFIRPAQAFNGRILAQSATEKTIMYESWEEVPGGKELPDTPKTKRCWFFQRPEYRIWGTTKGGWKAMWACYPQIALCTLNPLIFWVALLEALVFSSMVSIGETLPITLAAEPYLLSPKRIALVSLAAAFGSLLAWPASGYLVSYCTKKLAMHNHGVREAEHYLPAFILPVVANVASNILYGLAVQHSWAAGWVFFAYGLNEFAFPCLAVANILWVTEAFPRWAGPAIVIVNGLSYIGSFGASYAVLPWVRSQGVYLSLSFAYFHLNRCSSYSLLLLYRCGFGCLYKMRCEID